MLTKDQETIDLQPESVWLRKDRKVRLSHIGTTDAEIVVALSGRPAPSNWCLRPFIFFFCLAPPAAILLMSIVAGGNGNPTWPAQFALGVSTLGSLFLLGDRPLINPLQAIVFLFHWWFSFGPGACAVFFYLSGDVDSARPFYENQSGAIWVVAAGLPIFAVCVRLTLRFAGRARLGLRFLEPSGVLYSVRTLAAYLAVAAGVYAILFVLGRFGYKAFEEINYLGGQLTVSPALAAVNSVTKVGQFATIGLLGYLAVPARQNWSSRSLRIVALFVMLGSMALALTSGSKGAIVMPVFFLGLLLFTYRQRVPWALVLSILAIYLVFVEPFVSASRGVAGREGASDSNQRVQVFQEELREFQPITTNWRDFNVESPFRFIYSRAVEVAAISSPLYGPWQGQSLRDGFSAIVPRFIDPNKADSDMGNFFARELENVGIENDTNIALTMPFEFVGNYGFAAGVLSFGVIGVFWTLFVCLLLSEARLATHPLMPFCVFMTLGVEASVGQFVNSIKDLPIPLAAAWLVWYALGHRKRTV